MARTGYTTYWAPIAGTDLRALAIQHQRVFKGNQLAIVDDVTRGKLVKVAVLAGDTPPRGATTEWPVQSITEMFETAGTR